MSSFWANLTAVLTPQCSVPHMTQVTRFSERPIVIDAHRMATIDCLGKRDKERGENRTRHPSDKEILR